MDVKHYLQVLEVSLETGGTLTLDTQKQVLRTAISVLEDNERLRAALEAAKEAIQHDIDCDWVQSPMGKPLPCTCDADAAKAAIDAALRGPE